LARRFLLLIVSPDLAKVHARPPAYRSRVGEESQQCPKLDSFAGAIGTNHRKGFTLPNSEGYAVQDLNSVQRQGKILYVEDGVGRHWIVRPRSVCLETARQMIDQRSAVIMRREGRERLNHIPRLFLGLVRRTMHDYKRCAAACELKIVVRGDLFRPEVSRDLLHQDVSQPRLFLLKFDEVAALDGDHLIFGKPCISQLPGDLLSHGQIREYRNQTMERIKNPQCRVGFLKKRGKSAHG
jgi:hypothetical protein